VDLGAKLLDARVDNIKGFWESEAAFTIDEQLLADLERSWADVRELPDSWMDSDAADVALGRILRLAETEFQQSLLWALKDPRLCRLAPLWIKAFRLLGIRVSVVMMVRDPQEVAESLYVRDGLDRGYSHLLWAQHVLEAEQASRGLPRVMVSFDELLNDWEACMTRVSSGLNIEWPKASIESRDAIASYLSADDRHHWAQNTSASNFPSDFTTDVYELCRRIECEAASDWSGFEAMRSRYSSAAELFSPGIAELARQVEHHANERRKQIDIILAEKDSALALYQAHIEKLDGMLDERNREVAKLLHDVAALAVSHSELTSSKFAVDRDLFDVTSLVADLNSQLAKLAGENDELAEGFADSERKLAALQDSVGRIGWLSSRLFRTLAGRVNR
jgi:hypothetical protein